MSKLSICQLNALEKSILERVSEANPGLREIIEGARVIDRIAIAAGTRTILQSVPIDSPAKSTATTDILVSVALNVNVRAELRCLNGGLLYLDTMSLMEPQMQEVGDKTFEATLDFRAAPKSEGQLRVEELASLVVSLALDDDSEVPATLLDKKRPLQH